MLPPARSRSSNTCTSTPSRCRWNPRASPEMPAPTTATRVREGGMTAQIVWERGMTRSDRAGEGALALLALEVSVEDHGDIADEETTEPGHLNAVVAEAEEAVPLVLPQRLQLGGEVGLEVQPESPPHLAAVHVEVAHDLGDQVPADLVVRRQQDPTQHRQPPGAEGLVVRVLRLLILDVGTLQVADAGNAEGDAV